MNIILNKLVDAALGKTEALSVPGNASGSRVARRRKKLWELPHRAHCPLVGTCLPVTEMRKLAVRAGFDVQTISDYTLHTTFVGHCESRCELSELIQRFFEKRYALMVQRFSKVKDEAAVLAHWQEVVASGIDVPGALWAAWSHPDLGEEGGKTLYGDIHMLSHQDGAQARADLRLLEHLKQENRALRDEATALRHGLNVSQREADRRVAEMQRHLTAAEQRAALLNCRELELAAARQAAQAYANLRERAEAMSVRIETLEERNAQNLHRAEQLAQRLNETQDNLAAAEAALEIALGIGQCEGISGTTGCGRGCPAETSLIGRCVLCIGGRTNLVDGYRRLVETRGGRFLHHDGGQEESLHRIDAVVASADAVVCQAGCVSHAAYYRLKEACKKLGKPCVFVQTPGVVSFARGLTALDGEATAGTVGRLT